MPHPRRPIKPIASLLALAFALAACGTGNAEVAQADKPRVGLFTSLPILWNEGDIASTIDAPAAPDWVRSALEQRYRLVPLDTLEPEALAGLDRVILAQPRPLAPSENVAFDAWVERGGHAVVLADPMLTRHSAYPVGDRRRPQDVVLLSPLLRHWGLDLTYDGSQQEGERTVDLDGRSVPVNLSGRFVPVAGATDAKPVASCILSTGGLLAHCARGAGEAMLFADAAILDWDGAGEPPADRYEALAALTESLAD